MKMENENAKERSFSTSLKQASTVQPATETAARSVQERLVEKRVLPFQVEIQSDERMYEDEHQTIVQGVNGFELIYEQFQELDGVIDERTVVKKARVERIEPINEVRIVGCKPVSRQEIKTEVSEIPFETTYIYEASVPAGQIEMRLDGRNGVHTQTVRLTYQKERIVKREVLKTVQTTPVRHRLVAFGDVVVANIAQARRFIQQTPSVKRFVITDGKNRAYLQKDTNGYRWPEGIEGWSLYVNHAVPVVAFYEGQKDVSVAINQAIEAAVSMNVPRVEMPTGQTFNCDHTIILKNGLSILNGNGSTLIASAKEIVHDGMSALIAFEPEAHHTVISGFRIDMNHAKRLRCLIAQGTINSEVSQNTIYNVASNAILITTSALSATRGVRIMNNEIHATKQDETQECPFNLIDVYGVGVQGIPQLTTTQAALNGSGVNRDENNRLLAQQHALDREIRNFENASNPSVKNTLTATNLVIEGNRLNGGKCGIYLSYTSHNQIVRNEFMNQLRHVTLQHDATMNEVTGNLFKGKSKVAILVEEGANYNTITMNYIAVAQAKQPPIVVANGAIGNQIKENHLMDPAELTQQLATSDPVAKQAQVATQKRIADQSVQHEVASTSVKTTPTSLATAASDVIDFDPANGDKISLDPIIAKRLKGNWFAASPLEITDETVIFQKDHELYVDASTDATCFMATKFATLRPGIQLTAEDFILQLEK